MVSVDQLTSVLLVLEFIWSGTLLFSLLQPHQRIWPPGVKFDLRWWLTWVLTVLVLGGVVYLAWVDRRTLDLSSNLHYLGALLIITGFPFGLWGVLTLGWVASSGVEHRIVDSGPYRYSRNPQYVSDLMMLAGLALFSGSTAALLPIAGASLWFLLAPLTEEPWLEDLYGEEYLEYRGRVRRFL